eukprot:4560725-Prymnesium_polylepis.1
MSQKKADEPAFAIDPTPEEDSPEGEGEDNEEYAAWYKELEPFDLAATLKVTMDGERVGGGDAAIRASFHKRAWPAYPRDP